MLETTQLCGFWVLLTVYIDINYIKPVLKNNKQNTVKKVKKMGKNDENSNRKQQLLQIFDEIQDVKGIILPLIDDVIFIEDQLQALRKLPFIKVHPDFPELQKATPAAKQYKELLQQYNNCIKILTGILRKDAPEEESPLRAFLESRKEDKYGLTF